MSITSLLNIKEVTKKVTPLRPKMPRKVNAPIKAEPQSNHYAVVGTAFDYFLRFELQRQVPHAISSRLVAELVPDKLWHENENGIVIFPSLAMDSNGLLYVSNSEPDEDMVYKVANDAKETIESAKSAIQSYVSTASPTPEFQAELASHSLRLAKLDEFYRSGKLDSNFRDVDSRDVDDLLAILSIVPFESFLDDKLLLLNPHFAESSLLVGGADADLIVGNMLVDLKTTKQNEMRTKDLDQLLGYLILARNQREINPEFPVIDKLALYFCRHGYLWVQDVEIWTNNPEFNEIESWFLAYAEKEFGTQNPRPSR